MTSSPSLTRRRVLFFLGVVAGATLAAYAAVAFAARRGNETLDQEIAAERARLVAEIDAVRLPVFGREPSDRPCELAAPERSIATFFPHHALWPWMAALGQDRPPDDVVDFVAARGRDIDAAREALACTRVDGQRALAREGLAVRDAGLVVPLSIALSAQVAASHGDMTAAVHRYMDALRSAVDADVSNRRTHLKSIATALARLLASPRVGADDRAFLDPAVASLEEALPPLSREVALERLDLDSDALRNGPLEAPMSAPIFDAPETGHRFRMRVFRTLVPASAEVYVARRALADLSAKGAPLDRGDLTSTTATFTAAAYDAQATSDPLLFAVAPLSEAIVVSQAACARASMTLIRVVLAFRGGAESTAELPPAMHASRIDARRTAGTVTLAIRGIDGCDVSVALP